MFLKILTLPDLWRQSRVDAAVWVITCLATVFLETDLGLLVGVIACIFFVLVRSQVSVVDIIAEIPVGDGCPGVWREQNKYLGGKRMRDGIKVARINSAVYFANAEVVTDQVFKKTGVNPVKLAQTTTVRIDINPADDKHKEDGANHVHELDKNSSPSNIKKTMSRGDAEKIVVETQHVPNHASYDLFSILIIDLSCVPFLDLMGVQALEFLLAKYQAVSIDVYFVNVQKKCVDILQKNNFLKKHKERVYVTMNAALQVI